MNNVNKELLLTIQREYQPTDTDYFLCDSSPTFRSLWSKNHYEIRDLAKIFMTIEDYKEKYNDFFFVGHGVLFVHNNSLSFESVDQKTQIRRDFLTWLIKQTEE